MSSQFKTRLISSLVLIPLVIGVLWVGGLFLALSLLALYVLSVREWLRISERNNKRHYPWTIFGMIYCAVSLMCLYDVAEHPPMVWLPLCIFISVWLSDTTAYLLGKSLGGPKLAPSISPNKTWAGLIGAFIGPAIGLFLFQLIYDQISGYERDLMMLSFFILAIEFGIIIGLSGQIGDLLVSHLKRKSGVKDTGSLIPGHGGVLDRIDALLLVTIVFWIWMQIGGYKILVHIEEPWISIWMQWL
jgi:phosphatidate cytidylyltransferase